MSEDESETDAQLETIIEQSNRKEKRAKKDKKNKQMQPSNMDAIFTKIKCDLSAEVILSLIVSIIETVREEDFKKEFNYFHGNSQYKLQKKGSYPAILPDNVDKFLRENHGGKDKLKYISGNELKKDLYYTFTYVYNEIYWSITKLYYIRNELLYIRDDCKFLMQLFEKEDYDSISLIINDWKNKLLYFLARIEREINININKEDIDSIAISTDLVSRKNTLYLIINKLEKISAEHNWENIYIKHIDELILIPPGKNSDIKYPTEISMFELMTILYERHEGLGLFKNHSSYSEFKKKFAKISQDFQADISRQFMESLKEEYEVDNKYIIIDNMIYTKLGDVFANFIFYLARDCINYAMNFNIGGSAVSLSINNIKMAFASINTGEYTNMNAGMQNVLHYINISAIN